MATKIQILIERKDRDNLAKLVGNLSEEAKVLARGNQTWANRSELLDRLAKAIVAGKEIVVD